MSQLKTCAHCGHTGSMHTDFGEWDKLCKTCRAEAGPMEFGKRTETNLTPLQQRILRLREEELTQPQIARRLGTTDMAVRQHLTAMRSKGYDVAYEEEVAV